MQYKFLNNKNNENLILFFNGWAMDEDAVKNLDFQGYDVIMINDYTDFNFDFSCFDFKKYKKKYLVCWSMGVYCANLFYDILVDFDKKIAINGTPKMIDDNFGIPKKVYNLTVRLFNEKGLDKFIQNIGLNIHPKRSLQNLKQELVAIQNITFQNELNFDKAIVSRDDKIVPPENQIEFWKTRKVNHNLIDSAHYPFNIYNSWQDLLC